MRPTIMRSVLRLLPLVCLLAAWQLACSGNRSREFLFSTPAQVAVRIWNDLASGRLVLDTLLTGLEATAGLVAASILGTLIGLLLASVESIAMVFNPYLRIFGAVPVYALAPMTIIWLGIGFRQKAVIAGLSCIFVACAQAFQGARYPPEDQLLVFRAFRATRWQLLVKLRLPVALAWVASACRLNVGFALLGAFLAEIISSNAGLGHYIMKASSLYDVAGVLSGVILLMAMAFVLDAAANAVLRRYGRSAQS